MDNYVHEIAVKWVKEIDNKIFGEIQSKATERGLKTEYFLNEKAIISALEKQIPKKPVKKERGRIQCVNGHNQPVQHYKYCPMCGQLIDWREIE